MSACKAGCGVEAVLDEWFCRACCKAWIASRERERFFAVDGFARESVAVTDFCNRTRAERAVRNNEVPRAE